MSWKTSIKGFKSYLKIERSLSENSVESYIRDIKKLEEYSIRMGISELKVTKKHSFIYHNEFYLSKSQILVTCLYKLFAYL